jgi:general secretion pathway protein E
VQLVDRLLLDALRRNASDLHVQPLAERTLVRYRVDGVLHTAQELSPEVSLAVVSRIKVMGRMDIAERRVPQDGRATVTVGDAAKAPTVDLRISTLPTSYGERAVVRLLSNEQGQWRLGFDELGMPDETQRLYLEAAGRSHGMLLVVGPTGSGKTTTLYTTLRRLATHGERGGGELNITTVEDPIEYELSTVGLAISQTQVNAKKGVTFLSGLRYILRQDPDVIMVGEIRDSETARIAIQASLTGHLVFSTLHTKDAVGTVLRLIDLGVEPYLLTESLSAVLAQRLVRRRHVACNGDGCAACFQTGLCGRIGIFELLPMTAAVAELIASARPRTELLHAAQTAGMRTLAEEGDRLVRERVTTATEVRRVVTAAGGATNADV